ncbi:DUF2330 domain-containing protein [bacterium]|nr:DUF2330 domain-containing protein [bacterium]
MTRAQSRFLAQGSALALLVGAAGILPVRGACCYFAAKDKDINQPGQKAFITWSPEEKIESFTVQPKFEGNALDFGMVVPTPSQPKLDEMPRDFFKDLAIYTILMPLPQPIYLEDYVHYESADGNTYCKMKGDSLGVGGGSGRYGGSIRVLESGVVGSLDYRVIKADDATNLFEWLKENGYSYGGDSGTLDFYIKKKWFFTVMKIDPRQMKKNSNGSYLGEVTPTRFTFESEKCVYPLKITQISVKDKTDALFYVHSKDQLDLDGDLSFQHSYRCMYLTYMLGCGARPEEQKELQARNEWMGKKKKADARFETSKLEWARKLGDSEIAVLEDPLKNYAQMGNALARGTQALSVVDFLKEVRESWENPQHVCKCDECKKRRSTNIDARIKDLADTYKAEKGVVGKTEQPSPNLGTKYVWYPNREAPADDVKGLTRLKGHLQKGKWLTKIRKHIRKDEMSDDLVFAAVPEGQEQDYVRIMPTSPP